MATYDEIATFQLRNLCRAIGLANEFPRFLDLQRFLLQPWSARDLPARAPYASHIGDDHSPYEYSVVFAADGTIEPRLLVEAQADVPGLVANHRAALDLTDRLAARFGVDLERFRTIADLFFPARPLPPFTLWHAVCLPGHKKPSFKAYFNPQVRGAANARRLVEQALGRLGFADAARRVLREGAWRGPDRDVPTYFSLDLSGGAAARVKVYHAHRAATAGDIERSFRIAPTYRAGDVTAYCRTMVGHEGPFDRKPITSCFAFVEGSNEPQSVTLHFPIAHYVADDNAVADRVTAFLAAQGLPAGRYATIVRAIASRPLSDGVGIQSYASYRRQGDAPQLTVYLSPELFRGAWRQVANPPSVPARAASAS